MLTHPTLDQLRTLKLDGMAPAFAELEAQDRAKELSHAEWLALLLDREAASRECVYRHELDMATLVCTRGRDLPLARLAERLRCPQCGSREVSVMYDPPANLQTRAERRPSQLLEETAL